MQLSLSLFGSVLFATTILAVPEQLSGRSQKHGLMKRHFWCNGVDSENICPEGDTMVPIDSYACGVIAAANRGNEISPPVGDETHTTCSQFSTTTGPTSISKAPTSTPTLTSSAPASTSSAPVNVIGSGGSGESSVYPQPKEALHASKMHLTCTEADTGVGVAPAGSFFLLNCTMAA